MKVFVLGSPRSGTTAVGSFIGSHPACCDLTEYYGFYSLLHDAPDRLAAMPQSYKRDYLEHLFSAALNLAEERRMEQGAQFWCDQTPWNILVAQELVARFSDALFVLMTRDFRGVVQSLRRAYADGYDWAGKQIEDSAHLWNRCYSHAAELPRERTVVVSYDRLCSEPQIVVPALANELGKRLDVDPMLFRVQTFASSHATRDRRPTIAALHEGAVSFNPIASYDVAAWTEGMEAVCEPIVRDVRLQLSDLLECSTPK